LNLEVRKKGAVTGNPLPLRGTDNGDGTASLDMTLSGSSFSKATGGVKPSEAALIGGENGGNIIAFAADASGRIFARLQNSSGGEVTGATGAAVPAGAVMVGGKSTGGNLTPIMVAAFGSGDTLSTGTESLLTAAEVLEFNNGSFDRRRNNTERSIMASAARTTSAFTGTLTNYNGKGLSLNIDVTAKVGATTLTVNLQWYDSVASAWVTLASVAGIAAAVGSRYQVVFLPEGVDADYATNVNVKNVSVPRTYRVWGEPSDADSVTYSVFENQHVA
jgi:hypothetical protein